MTGDLEAARDALRDAVAVVCHTDADGLAAGAIALRHRGETAADAVLLGRGQSPFAPDAALPDGLLAILDWGVRPLSRVALIVDHHAPEAPPAPLTVSAYGEEPEISTAPLMRRLVPDAPCVAGGHRRARRPRRRGLRAARVRRRAAEDGAAQADFADQRPAPPARRSGAHRARPARRA